MGVIDKFKRDIAKRPGRAALLGVLAVTMVAMSVRAFYELHPRDAVGSSGLPPGFPLAEPDGVEAIQSGNADAKINENRELWNTLREKNPKAVDASAAFTFDASFFTLDPSAHVTLISPEKPEALKPAPSVPIAPPVDAEAIKLARIREQAKGLVVKSTAMGDGITQPMAIVNQQLLTVGQTILGFEMTAIRAREVEFKKEGETIVVKMLDAQ